MCNRRIVGGYGSVRVRYLYRYTHITCFQFVSIRVLCIPPGPLFLSSSLFAVLPAFFLSYRPFRRLCSMFSTCVRCFSTLQLGCTVPFRTLLFSRRAETSSASRVRTSRAEEIRHHRYAGCFRSTTSMTQTRRCSTRGNQHRHSRIIAGWTYS